MVKRVFEGEDEANAKLAAANVNSADSPALKDYAKDMFAAQFEVPKTKHECAMDWDKVFLKKEEKNA